jgi:hypothetical protein
VALDGDLVVAGGGSTLAAYDLSGSQPALRGAVTTAGQVARVRLSGRLAVVAESTGVELWDVGDPASPALVASLAVPGARDAVISGAQLVVAAGTTVRTYPVPAVARPSARLRLPADGAVVSGGQSVLVAGAASGVGLDDVELLVDGVPSGHLDDGEPAALWQVPLSTSPGRTLTLQLHARGAGGESLSPVRHVSVGPPSQEDPTVSVYSLSTPALAGQTQSVSACALGGSGPLTVTAAFVTASGARYGLGALAPTGGYFWNCSYAGSRQASVPMPSFPTDQVGNVEVEVVDALGRVARGTTPLTLTGDGQAPSAPGPLPDVLRTGPAPNPIQLRTTDDGVVTLWLELDGRVVASVREAALSYTLVLPNEAAGHTVTLKAVAMDSGGRRTEASRQYVVLSNAPPAGSFGWYGMDTPPATAIEGSQIVLIRAEATDPDCNLASAALLANGVELTRTTGTAYGCGVTLNAWNYRFPARRDAEQVAFQVVATDSLGLTSTTTLTTQVVVGPPPTLSLTADRTPVGGQLIYLCAVGRDDTLVAGVTLTVDGVPVSGQPSCAYDRTNCSLCTSYLVPNEPTLLLEGSASDLSTTVAQTQTFSVVPPVPPTPYLYDLPSFLVAGSPVTLGGHFYGQNPNANWLEFRANGAVVGSRIYSPRQGYYYSTTFAPATTGDTLVELVVNDANGDGVASQHVRVLPGDTGASCETPSEAPASGGALTYPVTLSAPVSACGGTSVTKGTWVSLPYDGPVESLELHGAFLVKDGCAGAVTETCDGQVSVGPLGKDARLLVRDGYSLHIYSATLGPGALCDPASTSVLCGSGVCDDAGGMHRCRHAACADGVDNDGDGKVDFPADPGCASPGADDEGDPANAPACANGADDDGDGQVDYPADSECGAASSEDEQFCVGAMDGWIPSELPHHLNATVHGAPSGRLASGTCGDGTLREERIYGFKAPYAGTFSFQVWSSNGSMISLRDAGCAGPELACSANWDPSYIETALAAGQTVAVVVEGMEALNGGTFTLDAKIVDARLPAGAQCDPASLTAVCDYGFCEPAVGGGFQCRRARCSDGVDDDGDGDGKVDFPADPGCAWAGDDDEGDPPAATACANGVDDDGDGLADRGGDPQCSAASLRLENFCDAPASGSLGDLPLPIHIADSTAGLSAAVTSSCGGGPERIYAFTAPATGTYQIDVTGQRSPMRLDIRRDTCDGPSLACLTSRYSADPQRLAAGETIAIIVRSDTYYDSSPNGGTFTLDIALTDALLPAGAACAPDGLRCAVGACAQAGDGQYSCRAPACSNGIDDDGNGKVDWPDDPGCAWAGADRESPPAVAPACSNGADDDGNGSADWPAEARCAGAGGASEMFCASPASGSLHELPVSVYGDTTGGTAVASSCGDSSAGRIYEFVPPVDGSYEVYVQGYGFQPALTVRDGSCTGEELACSTPYGAGDAEVWTAMTAGQVVAVAVADPSGATGPFTMRIWLGSGGLAAGAPCAASGVCGGYNQCLPSPDGGSVCRRPACFDGVDNDGDGLIDYPYDQGCASPDDDDDDDEADPPTPPACADGADNDGDGLVDYGNDPQCQAASASSEASCPWPAATVPSAVELVAVAGSTSGAENHLAGRCGGGDASDVIYRWVVPYYGVYRIDTAGSAIATVLYVRRYQCGGEEVACARGGSGFGVAVIEEYFDAGEEVFIIVDGAGASGDYQLHIRPAREYCHDGIDNDGNGLVDFGDPTCAGQGD